jgi:hypothetical protein
MTTSRHHYHHDHHYHNRRRRPFLAQCCQAAHHRRAGPARGSCAAGPNPCSSGIERSHVCMPPQTWRPGARSKGLSTYPAAAAAGQTMAEDSRRRRQTSRHLFFEEKTAFHSSKTEILMKLGGLYKCEQASKQAFKQGRFLKIKTAPGDPLFVPMSCGCSCCGRRRRAGSQRWTFDIDVRHSSNGFSFSGFSAQSIRTILTRFSPLIVARCERRPGRRKAGGDQTGMAASTSRRP